MTLDIKDEQLGTIYFVDYYDGILNGLLVALSGNCYLFEAIFNPMKLGHFERKMAFARIPLEAARHFLDGCIVSGYQRYDSIKFIWIEVTDQRICEVYQENPHQFLSYMLRDNENLSLSPLDEQWEEEHLARNWGKLTFHGEAI